MKEIINFIVEELRMTEKNKREIGDKIRMIKLDMESIDKAIDKIIRKRDDTSLIFLSANSVTGFDGDEAERLEQQKSDLADCLKKLFVQLDEQNIRGVKLEKLVREYKDKQRKLTNFDIIKVQEADRQRIARDIHDTVVQNLTALELKNEFITNIMETDMQRAKLEIQTNSKILKESIEELRNIIYDLRPMALGDLGFEKTFYNLMGKIDVSTDMIVKYEFDTKGYKINPIVSITVVRMIHELCTNSIKYSGGNNIYVKIEVEDNKLIIVQSDDGKGYDLKKDECTFLNNTGFGIPMLKESVTLLDGTVLVTSNPETGSKYVISIPIYEGSKDVSEYSNCRGSFNG